MSLTTQQIQQIAHLARLDVKADQLPAYAQKLSNIFQLVGELSKANTDHVTPMAHPLEMTQRLRPDVVTEPDQRESFQQHAPAVAEGLYLVPKVIE